MDILERYEAALKLYREKKFNAALEIVKQVEDAAPHWKKSFLLEIFIRRDKGESLKEFSLLEKLLPRFDLNSADEKNLAADAFNCLGAVCRFLGRTANSVRAFCLSANFSDENKKSCEEMSNAIFSANAIENFSAEDFQKLYDEYEKFLADVKPFPKKFYNHKKIRVGFMSANFHWSVVMAWSWKLLRDLDKNFFETYFYSAVKNPDDVTEFFRATADVWRDINFSDEDAAKIIREDEIDILFDLDGHTDGNRLRVAAYRPASVQISGIGYMGSTGLKCFDYFLSDEICAGDENFFVEKVLKLPHSHICYEPPTKLEPAENPPCLKNNFVTFGSFNNFAKVTDSILLAWKKILDAVPQSRLILKHKIFNTTDEKNFVGERLKSFGFDLSRVEMRPFSARSPLAEYADVDIALDTFPYTGGITTCEALFMGVPVISLYGKRHGSRFGLSILKNVGLEELAVDSLDEYIRRAVMLAGDWELLTILRKNLRAMMKKSPLMDSKNYLREIQSAFKKILEEKKILNVYELYSQALERHKEKKYFEALKILDEIKILAPNYKKAYMFESLIWKTLHNPFKEAEALGILLPKYDLSSEDEKYFAAHVLNRLGNIAMDFGLKRQGMQSVWFAAKLFEHPPQNNFSGLLSNAILKANAVENFSVEDFQKLYDDYEKFLADIKPFPKKFYAHKKIRVGFMSADFYRHVVTAWSWSLLTGLDKNFFETYFYSNVKKPDENTERLKLFADGWRDIFDLSDEEAARKIREDEIDILFDLSGHTEGNRLRVAAYRPASVQVSGIGYMGSTGLKCFDYFLSDEICAGDENFFVEKVIKLPHCHICYEPPKNFEPAENPPCVKNNFVTFGSFNRYEKMTDEILRTWKKILDAVPQSHLLLKHVNFGSDNGRKFVGERLKSFGFDLGRIEMRGVTPNHLVEYADVDIALDTFPYTGGITTCEALWMGVPVVSLYGKRHGTRFGLSILKNVGLDELAVDSLDEYINRAVMLANDWELLTILRKNLRTMMKKSPLMDSKNYIREIQSALKKILDEQKNFSSAGG